MECTLRKGLPVAQGQGQGQGRGRADDGSPGLREQEKLNKAARIRKAAEELFSEKSFEDVTTRELAERAQVGEATLFRYMTSKTEMLLLVYGDRMEELLIEIEESDAATAAAAKTPDGAFYCDRIHAIYRARADFYRRDPENASLYLREAFEAGSDPGGRCMRQGDRCVRLAAAVLAEGQAAGVISKAVDARLVAQNCHGIFIHEVDRTPVRGFTPESIWDRVRERLAVQLVPLVVGRAG